MKFLCDNCKAKYQIADEKVAGKTVRMKCRKCGHQIEVRAAVTETSVSTAPPKPDAPHAPARPAPPRTLATSLSSAKPRGQIGQSGAGREGSGALAGAFQRTVQDAPSTVPFPQHGPSNDRVELSVTDEWYVAINGVPVGPVRISELRRKAAAGAVTEDSLCWQEGLEEWRPIRSVPELAALVRDAAQGNRPSLVAPPPEPNRSSSLPPRPAGMAPRPPPRAADPARSDPPMAPRPPPAPQRSNVVPLRPAAQLDDMSPHTAPLGGGAAAAFAPQFSPSLSPALSPAPSPFSPAPSPFLSPGPAQLQASDPFAIPAPAPLGASFGASSGTSAPLGGGATPSVLPGAYEPARRAVPLWFWPILVAFLGFGAGGAVLLFRQPPPQQIVVQVPAPTAPTGTHVGDIPPPPTSSDTPTTPTPTTTGKVATGPSKPGVAPPSTTGPRAADISGLLGGSGGSGPAVPGGGGPGPSGGGTMDQAAVERVVASHRSGVKRTCWERSGADQKSSVNVTVNATVGPQGNVTSASSSGDDPVVAKCIENQVKSWQFPASGSSTPIQIPFKFVRQ